MPFDAHVNFGYSLVTAAPVPPASGGALTVVAGESALFPAPPFNAVVWPAGQLPLASNAEVVRVTARVGDTFTITRTQEGSSARTILVGDACADAITAKSLTDLEAKFPLVNADVGAAAAIAYSKLNLALSIVDGDVAAAAAIALSKLAAVAACRVRKAANQTITNVTNTAITFDTEDLDTDGMHDNAVNPTRVTAQRAGVFELGARVEWQSNVTGFRQAWLLLNGATIIELERVRTPAADLTFNGLGTAYPLSAGDYIELMVHQSSGGNLAVDAAANYSPALWAVYAGHV